MFNIKKISKMLCKVCGEKCLNYCDICKTSLCVSCKPNHLLYKKCINCNMPLCQNNVIYITDFYNVTRETMCLTCNLQQTIDSLNLLENPFYWKN